MTVGELRAWLERYDHDARVLIDMPFGDYLADLLTVRKDAEGDILLYAGEEPL